MRPVQHIGGEVSSFRIASHSVFVAGFDQDFFAAFDLLSDLDIPFFLLDDINFSFQLQPFSSLSNLDHVAFSQSPLLLLKHDLVVALPHEVFYCFLRSLKLHPDFLISLSDVDVLGLYLGACILMALFALLAKVHPIIKGDLVFVLQVGGQLFLFLLELLNTGFDLLMSLVTSGVQGDKNF